MINLDKEFRHFTELHKAQMEEEMVADGWQGGERHYNDIVEDKLFLLYKIKLTERVQSLSTTERKEILKEAMKRIKDNLEDDFIEQYSHEAAENLLLINLIETFLKKE